MLQIKNIEKVIGMETTYGCGVYSVLDDEVCSSYPYEPAYFFGVKFPVDKKKVSFYFAYLLRRPFDESKNRYRLVLKEVCGSEWNILIEKSEITSAENLLIKIESAITYFSFLNKK